VLVSLEQIYLKKTTVDSIVPKQQSLVIIDSKEVLPKAFQVLSKKNIYSAPVYDSESQSYLGFLDLLDIVAFVVEIIDTQAKTKLSASKQDSIDLYDLLEQIEKFDLEHTSRIIGLATKNPMCPIHTGSSVKKALEVFVRSGARRLPVVEGKHLKSILTQSALLHWLNANLSQLPAKLREKTVRELGIGLKEVFSVRIDTKAIEAFRLMAQRGIHGIAVLDENGEIFSNISAKDIKILEPEVLFTKMYKPVLELVQLVRSSNLKAVFPSFCVTMDNTFEEVIKKLAILGVHRLYIEDAKRRPIGVISLGDILKLFLEDPEERMRK